MRSLFAQLYNMGIRRFDTDTARNNTIAQSYYEKNGFINEGITRSYYRA
jgi:ribosomal protein S18 acetylase RimI-like enzyme